MGNLILCKPQDNKLEATVPFSRTTMGEIMFLQICLLDHSCMLSWLSTNWLKLCNSKCGLKVGRLNNLPWLWGLGSVLAKITVFNDGSYFCSFRYDMAIDTVQSYAPDLDH
ncbi:unnamed protein product [Vicia faba]|uniref:Uncharacterized protein n=1 Tax=Vicia faba TaxID=3906 RepID=A0AAV0ZW14_VICFA|nr:unnamed protein product [Vicia faba]